MTQGPFEFSDLKKQLNKIYQINGFLPKLKSLIDFEIFRSDLQIVRDKERLSKAGRPPFDCVLMFKILVLKSLYNLSDEKTEEQIRDRISFRDFLDLSFTDTVPDAKTIWLFAETLKNHELETKLFDRFAEELDRQGFGTKSGLIVDGTFVETPRRHLDKEENEQLKKGEIPETISENPNVQSQIDTDAEWTKKGNETYFGYKNHACVDDAFKFIRFYGVTGASTHDSQPYLDILPEEPEYPDQEAFADSAYTGEKIDTKLKDRGFVPWICDKGYRNNPLTDDQKETNRIKSSVRCRVEHIFGEQKMRMGNEILRSIGFARARFWIGMRNLVSNMSRLVSLKKPKCAK